jgi:hypothetical protein
MKTMDLRYFGSLSIFLLSRLLAIYISTVESRSDAASVELAFSMNLVCLSERLFSKNALIIFIIINYKEENE